MKVSSIIKLMDDYEGVVITERGNEHVCSLGESYQNSCGGYEENRCAECEHGKTDVTETTLFRGSAEDVPIRLAERAVKKICARDWTPRRLRDKEPYTKIEVKA